MDKYIKCFRKINRFDNFTGNILLCKIDLKEEKYCSKIYNSNSIGILTIATRIMHDGSIRMTHECTLVGELLRANRTNAEFGY